MLLQGMMVPEFEACAFSAEVGVPASCITQFGHHLVLVEEERTSAPEVQTMGPLDLAELFETLELVIKAQDFMGIAPLPFFI